MEFNNRLLLKIIELVITTSIIVLIESVANHGYSSEAMLVCGTLTGYLIICSALTIGHLLEAKLDKRIDILFAVAGCVLFISTGAIILDRWMYNYTTAVDRNTILSSGVLAFANGAVFIADTFGIAIGCIVLSEVINDNLSNYPLIVFGTIGGFTIICTVLLIGHLIGSVVEKRLNALIALLGCILFVASGALVIDKWHDVKSFYGDNKRNAIAAGSLMIINGAVFLLDTLSICRTRSAVPVYTEEKKSPTNKLEINRF